MMGGGASGSVVLGAFIIYCRNIAFTIKILASSEGIFLWVWYDQLFSYALLCVALACFGFL